MKKAWLGVLAGALLPNEGDVDSVRLGDRLDHLLVAKVALDDGVDALAILLGRRCCRLLGGSG